jgi:salicylate hydroxylase
MSAQVLIAGGGIGALAAALACGQAGCGVRLYEQAGEFSEVGAGLQLGPNATRLLQTWGLAAALQAVAAFPQRLQVRRAGDGAALGCLPLGQRSVALYGAPYAALHRADLHALLLQALKRQGAVHLNLNSAVTGYSEVATGVQLSWPDGRVVEADALIGADGLWSQVREQLLADGPAQPTGHLAYRALLVQSQLPQALRSQQVSVWLGPRLHVVSYPVRGGDLLNLVVIVHGQPPADARSWDHGAAAADVKAALAGSCAELLALAEAVPAWRLWTLNDRPSVQGPQHMARGRVALLGDAAHPMRPYLAQGAGMALEDADALARSLAGVSRPQDEVAPALARYAAERWQRSARVQARSRRNGRIFHATGALRWGRDVSMKLLGARVMDLPWLYGGPQR